MAKPKPKKVCKKDPDEEKTITYQLLCRLMLAQLTRSLFETVLDLSDTLKHTMNHYAYGTSTVENTTVYYGTRQASGYLSETAVELLRIKEAVTTIRTQLVSESTDAREDFIRCASLKGNDPLYKFAMTWLLRHMVKNGFDSGLQHTTAQEMRQILERMEVAWGMEGAYKRHVSAISVGKRALHDYIHEFSDALSHIQTSLLRGCSLCGMPSIITIPIKTEPVSNELPEEARTTVPDPGSKPKGAQSPRLDDFGFPVEKLSVTDYHFCRKCFDQEMRHEIAEHLPSSVAENLMKKLVAKL